MQRPSNNYNKDEKDYEQNHPLEQLFASELKFGRATFITALTSVFLTGQTANFRLSLGERFSPS
jgi:hypothetical protein